MSSDPQDFESLRKLMALKRHEQPPQEYLYQLSDSILDRIERGEGRSTLWDRISGNFSGRPNLACALGLTVCGVVGLLALSVTRQQMTQSRQAIVHPVNRGGVVAQNSRALAPMHVAGWLGNTNPYAEGPQLSLFESRPAVFPVAYITEVSDMQNH